MIIPYITMAYPPMFTLRFKASAIRRSDRSAQRSGSFTAYMESMEGPRKQPPSYRDPPCDRGTGRRRSCRTARGPPERLMRPEGAVVLARRTVLRSSSPRVRLAAIPPVKVASMPHGGEVLALLL